MKLIRRFFRHIREGFFGVIRHFGMAVSSMTSVTITLFLIGVFLVLTVNLNLVTKDIESSISLSALISFDNDSSASINNIRNQISRIHGVKSIDYRSKDDEFDYYVEMYPDMREFNELYRDENPFHDVFLVTVDDGVYLEGVRDSLLLIKGVESVYDGGGNTYVLINVLQKVRLVGSAVVVALCLLAIYLIFNTIKITIDSRSDELWIMRNIGARYSYIRAPFLVEGIIIGVLGSIIPILSVGFGYYYLYQYSGGVLLGVFNLLAPLPFLYYLGAVLLGTGVLVGFFGSFISVCKYLRGIR